MWQALARYLRPCPVLAHDPRAPSTMYEWAVGEWRRLSYDSRSSQTHPPSVLVDNRHDADPHVIVASPLAPECHKSLRPCCRCRCGGGRPSSRALPGGPTQTSTATPQGTGALPGVPCRGGPRSRCRAKGVRGTAEQDPSRAGAQSSACGSPTPTGKLGGPTRHKPTHEGMLTGGRGTRGQAAGLGADQSRRSNTPNRIGGGRVPGRGRRSRAEQAQAKDAWRGQWPCTHAGRLGGPLLQLPHSPRGQARQDLESSPGGAGTG